MTDVKKTIVLSVKRKPSGWLHSEDNGQVVSAAQKVTMENHQGMPGKMLAKLFSIPLYQEAEDEDYQYE